YLDSFTYHILSLNSDISSIIISIILNFYYLMLYYNFIHSSVDKIGLLSILIIINTLL
ncbi:mCG1031108, partial [Mus musculus]